MSILRKDIYISIANFINLYHLKTDLEIMEKMKKLQNLEQRGFQEIKGGWTDRIIKS